MINQDTAALFIRLLTKACEADRLIREDRLSTQHRALAQIFQRRQLVAMHQFDDAVEPLDCMQLMTFRSDEQQHI